MGTEVPKYVVVDSKAYSQCETVESVDKENK
jgi:hypothetical protein